MTRIIVWLALAAGLVRGQGIITTIAGADWVFPFTPRPGLDAPIGRIAAVGLDRAGNLYLADPDNDRVFRLAPDGSLTIVAGNGTPGYNGDNIPARAASLNNPKGVAVDAEGNLYIADTNSNRVRKVTPAGIISTAAGTGEGTFSGDGGPANEAALYQPHGVAVDSEGALYIGDVLNGRVRKVNRNGTIQTVAGTGVPGNTGDGGPATAAQIGAAFGLAVDRAGNLYIADERAGLVRKVTAAGIISTVAGNGGFAPPVDQVPATQTSLNTPGIALDDAGRLYISDGGNHRVRVVGADGTITTIAGTTAGYSGDGAAAASAQLNRPLALAVDSAGNLLIADSNNTRIRRVDGNGRITTLAGNGMYRFGGDGGVSSSAILNEPAGLAIDRAGNLYIADQLNHRVRRINANGGTITTVAGSGIRGFSGDGGPATSARLNEPTAVAVDASGNLYIADLLNHRIRRVAPDGTIATVAGGGDSRADGIQATTANLNFPGHVAVDAAGSIFFNDDFRIRRVTGGVIATVAGNREFALTRSPDGSQATNVPLAYLLGLALDATGNVYFGEQYSFPSVRRVSREGILTTVAGPGQPNVLGDGGPAIRAAVSPSGLSVDAAGNVYVSGQNRVRRISTDGLIQTVAGGAAPREGNGDGGSALNAGLVDPVAALVDGGGNLYISDPEEHRIRKVLNVQPPFRAAPESLTFTGKSGGALPADQTVTLAADIADLPFSLTADGGGWLTATPLLGVMPATVQVSVDPSALSPEVYEGRVTITSPNAVPPVRVVNVRFTVSPADAPTLAAEPLSMSFAAVSSAAGQSVAAMQNTLRVLNNGSGELAYRLTIRTTSGGDWLSVTPAEGRVRAAAPGQVTITADPSGLAPGTYSGLVTVTTATDSQQVFVPVTLTVNARQQTVVLSQSGLQFTTAAGAVPGPATFAVLNGGAGVMNWSLTAETLGGGNWLEVTPRTGASQGGGATPPLVEVRVRPEGLEPGDYYGRIEVVAAGAGNSPQAVSVALTVLEAGIAPDVRPTGLLFVGGAGAPPPQTVLVSNLGTTPATFRSSRTSDGAPFFTYQPAEATVGPREPVVLQVFAQSTTPGIRRGRITLDFGSTTRIIEVVLVVPPGPAAAEKETRFAMGPHADCAPRALAVVLTLLGQQFFVRSGAPVPVEAKVADDCGTLLASGSVVASFSNGDSPVNLVALGDGRWSGTWQPGRRDSQVRVTVTAENATRSLRGTTESSGSIGTAAQAPVVGAGAVLNSASYVLRAPVAPGSLISIFGERLASFSEGANPPLPTELGESLVVLGGFPLPVLYASPGQINAIVPYDLSVNTTHQLVVRRGRLLAVPEPITVAPAQPAVFTLDQTGTGQGLVFRATGTLAGPDGPAAEGETVVIYCAGLGAVAPAVAAGQAASSTTLSSVVAPVTVTIGGRAAAVSFAGLTPGFTGLYQVNAVVPAGVERGGAVPVVIGTAGQVSLPVTMAVR